MKALYALALVAGIAQAQSGVALTTPATASAADQARFAELAKEPWAGTITPVKINPNALESTVITVNIEGKDWRFVGSKKAATEKDSEIWIGDAGPGTSAILTRSGTNVTGTISLGMLGNYGLIRGAIVKNKDVPYPAKSTPEMLEAWAKEREEQTKKVGKP
jgi:hypothetical protein